MRTYNMVATLISSFWFCFLIYVVAAESMIGRLRNVKYDKCLRPAFNGKGAWITLDNCINTGSGHLTVDMSEIITYWQSGNIRFMSNWMCLKLNGNSLDNGHLFLTWDCLREAQQKWIPTNINVNELTFHLQLKHSGRCLSAENHGALVIQSDCVAWEDGLHQTWKFEPLETYRIQLLESVEYIDQCLTYTLSTNHLSLEKCDTNLATNMGQRVASVNSREDQTGIRISAPNDDICITALDFKHPRYLYLMPTQCKNLDPEWRVEYTGQENHFKLRFKIGETSLVSLDRQIISGPDTWKFRSFNVEERKVYMLESDFYGKCLQPNPPLFPEFEVGTCDAYDDDQSINGMNFLKYEFSSLVFKGTCLSTVGRFTAAKTAQARGNKQWCDLFYDGNCPIKFFDESLASVVQGRCINQAHQNWKIINGKLGALFQLQNEENGDCLTVKESSGQTSLWVDDCSKFLSEQFWSMRTGFV